MLVCALSASFYSSTPLQKFANEKKVTNGIKKEFDTDGAYESEDGSIDIAGIQLNYFGARYFDPVVAMWTSLDPKEQFWSGYSYSGNGFNPISATDPDGNELTTAAVGAYIVATMAAPDFQTDMMMLEVDLAAGDYVGVVGDAIGIALAGVPAGVTRGMTKAGQKTFSGIYEFVDNTGRKYVGKADDMFRRLKQHFKSGKLPDGAQVTALPIIGNKTTLEIAEHTRIQQVTGGVPARFSDAVSNKVDPIGPARQDLLPNQ